MGHPGIQLDFVHGRHRQETAKARRVRVKGTYNLENGNEQEQWYWDTTWGWCKADSELNAMYAEAEKHYGTGDGNFALSLEKFAALGADDGMKK